PAWRTPTSSTTTYRAGDPSPRARVDQTSRPYCPVWQGAAPAEPASSARATVRASAPSLAGPLRGPCRPAAVRRSGSAPSTEHTSARPGGRNLAGQPTKDGAPDPASMYGSPRVIRVPPPLLTG